MPAVVDEVVDAYLHAVDAEVRGLVEGLYLIGSAALGDFRPDSSDIDFVAVTAQRPDRIALDGLRHVHTRLRQRYPRPFFDGCYVTWDDLAGDPGRAGPGPHTHEGTFHPPGLHGGHSPVTWNMLAPHGLACRGPEPASRTMVTDPAALAAWTLDNLDAYWRRWLWRSQPLLTPHGGFALTPYATVWLVTGVSRMHYTLTTGGIISKEGAAHYALATFPARWHQVINEALRIRRADLAGSAPVRAIAAGAAEYLHPRPAERRPLYRTPLRRRRDALAFGDMVIADAHRVAEVNRTDPPR